MNTLLVGSFGAGVIVCHSKRVALWSLSRLFLRSSHLFWNLDGQLLGIVVLDDLDVVVDASHSLGLLLLLILDPLLGLLKPGSILVRYPQFGLGSHSGRRVKGVRSHPLHRLGADHPLVLVLGYVGNWSVDLTSRLWDLRGHLGV